MNLISIGVSFSDRLVSYWFLLVLNSGNVNICVEIVSEVVVSIVFRVSIV